MLAVYAAVWVFDEMNLDVVIEGNPLLYIVDHIISVSLLFAYVFDRFGCPACRRVVSERCIVDVRDILCVVVVCALHCLLLGLVAVDVVVRSHL